MLLILLQIFFVDFLMRLERHPAVFPNLETKRTDPTDYRHHRAEEEPNRHGHVLGRFAIFRAITKRTRARLLRDEKERSAYAQGYGATSHHKYGQKLFHVMMRS